jgi:hypothetical protein
MVEFALVAPIFFLVLFAFVEFALISASIGSFNFAAKEGARLGSLLGRTPPSGASSFPGCPATDSTILTRIDQQVNGVVMAKLVKVEIYRSDPQGNMLSNTAGALQEDVYDASTGSCTTVTWPPDSRIDSLIDADYLGVRITYQYTYLTSFISGGLTGITLSALSVQRIEPAEYQSHLVAPTPGTALATQTAPSGEWRHKSRTGGGV